MNIFEILVDNDLECRVIVLVIPEEKTIITWNKSCTLQAWFEKPSGKWREIEARTLMDIPKSFDEARNKAREWHATLP